MKTKKCFCCGNKVKDNEQICSKCGAIIPGKIDPVLYERNRKALKWSTIVGWVVGIFTTPLFGAIDPNSYLFLIGIFCGLVSAYLTSFCFDKYYKNQDENAKKQRIKEIHYQEAKNDQHKKN